MKLSARMLLAVSAACCAASPSFAAPPAGRKLPPNMHPVTPIRPPAASLQLINGHFFSYALPQGWRVSEEGQFALSLVAPDNKAITVMVGNAGMPPGYPPGRYVYDRLMSLGPQNLQVSQPRQTQPLSGFAQAFQFEVTYQWRGIPSRGLVKCHIAPAYDSALMVMTAALAAASDWPSYANWLPLVAEQVSARSGAAFGMRGVMAQNLQNSASYGEAVRQYRDWSQRNWQAVTNARDASTQRNHEYFRETLGGVNSWVNPYDSRIPVELPNTYNYFWVNRQGEIVGTNDPGIDPNVGSTAEWQRMPRHKR